MRGRSGPPPGARPRPSPAQGSACRVRPDPRRHAEQQFPDGAIRTRTGKAAGDDLVRDLGQRLRHRPGRHRPRLDERQRMGRGARTGTAEVDGALDRIEGRDGSCALAGRRVLPRVPDVDPGVLARIEAVAVDDTTSALRRRPRRTRVRRSRHSRRRGPPGRGGGAGRTPTRRAWRRADASRGGPPAASDRLLGRPVRVVVGHAEAERSRRGLESASCQAVRFSDTAASGAGGRGRSQPCWRMPSRRRSSSQSRRSSVETQSSRL